MPTGQEMVEKAMEMFNGKPYIYGYEVTLGDPHPKAGDCSEMVEAVCYIKGVRPRMPDGAIYQYYHCDDHDTLISIKKALKIPGALLFVIDPDNEHYHVAMVAKDGKTIECRGRDYGCGQFKADRPGWTDAALIPGVTYA